MKIILAAHSAIARRVMIVLVLVMVGVAPNGFGQSADEQQIKDVITQLFRGMELGDSAMVHKCFLPQPTMATVKATKEGKTILTREGNLAGFLKAVGTPHADKWYEETWNVRVSTDGQLAQVWCDYAFYLGNKYSHCGVDAFQLFKEGSQWKIFHLADTRKPSDCSIPSEISRKHTP
jgi:hypothetical protein